MKAISSVLLIAMVLLVILTPSMADTHLSKTNPHNLQLSVRDSQCDLCHVAVRQKTIQVKLKTLADQVVNGVDICGTCHESSSVKHMIGKRPDFKVPGFLPLDKEGRITCLTCHYTHGPLKSESPWVDVSWIEQLSNSDRLHKTFLLRRNNRDGRLCLACHDS
jgi:hypothetical protein